MGDQSIGGINAFKKSFELTKAKLIKSGNNKPTTKQIIEAMSKNNQAQQNDSIQGYFVEHLGPQTKYMPPVPQDSTVQTKYMPPVPPEPQTKYMPPVPQDSTVQTKYMPPVQPEPQTKYMPPVKE